MGILRRLGEWREDADGTLKGPALKTEDSHTDRQTIRFDPQTDDLQDVIDAAPEFAEIKGDRQTIYSVTSPIVVDVEGLVLRDVRLRPDDPDDVDHSDGVVEIRADNVEMRNAEVDGNREAGDPNNYSSVDVRGGRSGLKFVSVTSHSATRDSLALNDCEDITILDFEAYNFGDDGIDAEEGVNDVQVSVFHIHDDNPSGAGGPNAIEIEQGSSDWTISNGKMENIEGGLAVRDGQ